MYQGSACMHAWYTYNTWCNDKDISVANQGKGNIRTKRTRIAKIKTITNKDDHK